MLLKKHDLLRAEHRILRHDARRGDANQGDGKKGFHG
jgi:hypothetical protein